MADWDHILDPQDIPAGVMVDERSLIIPMILVVLIIGMVIGAALALLVAALA